VPEEPGRRAGDEERADLGHAGAVAEQRQVSLWGEVEGRRLVPGKVGGDRRRDVAPFVLVTAS
jgi:hypothetical protein